MSKISIQTLMSMKQAGEKIAMLTCYDAGFVPLLEQSGVDILLVGDSLGMVIQGHDTTLPVTVDQIAYHTACVSRVHQHSFVIADLPFLSYYDEATALRSAAQLMQQGGAQMIKLEGGQSQLAMVSTLAGHGVPVCGHLGLQPQMVHQLGGYRTQGKEPAAAEQMRRDARLLESAGAQMLVLECVPGELAAEISQGLSIPVIGIGAGPDCDGQVLVLYDVLGITAKAPPFAPDFMPGAGSIAGAIRAYVEAVKQRRFPPPRQEQK